MLRRLTTWRDWYNPLRGLTMARVVSAHDGLCRPISYSAPSGYHDDCVISLALAVSRRHAEQDVAVFRELPRPSPARMPRLQPRALA